MKTTLNLCQLFTYVASLMLNYHQEDCNSCYLNQIPFVCLLCNETLSLQPRFKIQTFFLKGVS